MDFEVVLSETTNTIDMLYQSLGTTSSGVTLGLETVDGTDGAILCSGSSACPVTSGSRFRWVPTP